MRRIAVVGALAVALIASTVSTFHAVAETGDLDFEPCGADGEAECGSLTVPIDWSRPDGDSLDLRVVRRVATDPKARLGTLFFNPGGPGTGAGGYVGDYAEATFSPTLREHFDLIGVDPRGVAGSGQIGCDKPVHDPSVRQFPRDAAEYDTLVEHNRAVADSCDPLIEHMDTDTVARDLDAVRQALGEKRISFLGQSYGSMLGTAYALRYPQRVRAMSLDAVVDRGMPAAALAEEGAAAVEHTFDAFAEWCRDDEDCALHGRDVGAVWDDLVETAAARPIPVPDGRAVTVEELRFAGYAYLNLYPEFGERFGAAIAAAETGDAGDFAAIRAEALENPDSAASYRAVMCRDIDPAVDGFDELRDRAKRVAAVSPHLDGTSEFWAVTAGCLGWPHPAPEPTPVAVDDVPPLLLVGNTGDPATPVAWAHRLSRGIDGSRVLTVDTYGHTAYNRSPCATAAIDAYLVDGELPAPDTVCTD